MYKKAKVRIMVMRSKLKSDSQELWSCLIYSADNLFCLDKGFLSERRLEMILFSHLIPRIPLSTWWVVILGEISMCVMIKATALTMNSIKQTVLFILSYTLCTVYTANKALQTWLNYNLHHPCIANNEGCWVLQSGRIWIALLCPGADSQGASLHDEQKCLLTNGSWDVSSTSMQSAVFFSCIFPSLAWAMHFCQSRQRYF